MKWNTAAGCKTGRRWAVAMLLGGSMLSSVGCSLIPDWNDVRTAGTTVKDHVTGKARQDRLNKQYAEARIMERRKDFAGAEAMYREILKEEPKSRDCYHRLGVIAAQQTKYDEAHQLYQQALQYSTPTPDLWNDIGFCFYLQNKMPEAEQSMRQTLAIDPQHRAALNNLAMVVGEQGRIDEAYDLFRRGNSEAEAEQNIGFLCAACGELERAQHHFSRALSANPEMRPAAEALIQVTQAMQRRQDYFAAQGQVPATPGQQVVPANAEAPQQGAPYGNDPNVVPAGGFQAAPGSVQQTSAQMPANPPRRLIEVYSAARRTPAQSQQIAQAANAATTAGTTRFEGAPVQTPLPFSGGAPGSVNPQSVPVQSVPVQSPGNPVQPGTMSSIAPNGGFQYPNMAQPQYLQPSNASPMEQMRIAQQNAAAATDGRSGRPTAGNHVPTTQQGNFLIR
ncbi:MAG: hypothetical protein C0483_14300 [Pirellula sp.]|nr:hypothetical protein [Pirellula sp.]